MLQGCNSHIASAFFYVRKSQAHHTPRTNTSTFHAHICRCPCILCRNTFAFRGRKTLNRHIPRHSALCLPCSQNPEPPQSLHLFFCLPCSQSFTVPQSLQLFLRLPCSQSFMVPQSLQLFLRLLCLQNADGLQSRHASLRVPCLQTTEGLHSPTFIFTPSMLA